MQNDPMLGGIREGVQRLSEYVNDAVAGGPPGARPVPLKAQIERFLAVAPDLAAHGPAWQQIEAEHGPGSADQYAKAMSDLLLKGRQRRSPV